jgi:hypothetical protein
MEARGGRPGEAMPRRTEALREQGAGYGRRRQATGIEGRSGLEPVVQRRRVLHWRLGHAGPVSCRSCCSGTAGNGVAWPCTSQGEKKRKAKVEVREKRTDQRARRADLYGIYGQIWKSDALGVQSRHSGPACLLKFAMPKCR